MNPLTGVALDTTRQAVDKGDNRVVHDGAAFGAARFNIIAGRELLD